jgi:hypothetical protein
VILIDVAIWLVSTAALLNNQPTRQGCRLHDDALVAVIPLLFILRELLSMGNPYGWGKGTADLVALTVIALGWLLTDTRLPPIERDITRMFGALLLSTGLIYWTVLILSNVGVELLYRRPLLTETPASKMVFLGVAAVGSFFAMWVSRTLRQALAGPCT